MSISFLAYNHSIAQDYIPLTKDQVLALGARWRDEEPIKPPAEKVEIPDSINDTNQSICDRILTCEETGKPYKIIPQEFDFYKRNGIPIPQYCFEVRHKNRLKRRNPRKLFDRQCAKCRTAIKTTYSPDRPEIVYCEACYLKEVY